MPESGDMEALLYSIDVKHLLHQYSNQKNQNVAFQWNMRSHCSSQFSISSSSFSSSHKTRIFQDSRDSSSASSSLPYVSDYDINSNPPSRVINTFLSSNNGNKKSHTESSKTANTVNKYKTDSTLHWEIRIPTPQGGSVVSDGTIMLPPSPTCVERTEGGWVQCRGVILAEDIPLKGKIEIWVLNKSKNRKLNAIDVNQLEVSNVSTTIKSTSLEWNSKDSNEGINSNSRKIPFVNDVILQKGGDHEGWSYQYNQFCSLQYIFNNVKNHFDYPYIPEGFKMFRRILCLIDSSNNYNNNSNNYNYNNNKYISIVNNDNNRKCKIIFQAKLKSDGNGNNKSNLANSKNMKDKEKFLEKNIDGFGYKWCVTVKRFTAMVTSAGTGVQITATDTGTGTGAGRRMEIVARGKCVHLNNLKEGPETGADMSSKRYDTLDVADITDSKMGSKSGKYEEKDNNNYNNNDDGKNNNNKINKNSKNDFNDDSQDQPWIWTDISADLGPLHSGDEAVLCASPITMDGKTENINSFCSVEIRNFRYFYTISKNENRLRNENFEIAGNVINSSKTAMTDKQQSEYDESKVSQYFSKLIRIENRLHHIVHNDQSIAIPYF